MTIHHLKLKHKRHFYLCDFPGRLWGFSSQATAALCSHLLTYLKWLHCISLFFPSALWLPSREDLCFIHLCIPSAWLTWCTQLILAEWVNKWINLWEYYGHKFTYVKGKFYYLRADFKKVNIHSAASYLEQLSSCARESLLKYL